MGNRVFLSYGRGDDEPFVRTLYSRLDKEGFDVWFDRECMPSRALTFLQEIRDAIRSRDRVVVVLGPYAVGSDYVRAEWQAGLVDGKVVVPVLRMGDYDLVPPELRNLHCPDARVERPLDEALGELLRVLSDPVPPLGRLVGPIPSVPAHFQPPTDALSKLAGAMLYEIEHPVVLEPQRRTMVLHGMGGVGKSILASAFARATSTRRVFMDGVVWIDVTPSTTPLELMRSLLAAIGHPMASPLGVGEAVTFLRGWLEPRRCLLVLDNVWSVSQAAPVLQTISTVSRLLITSRDGGLATSFGSESQLVDTLTPTAACAHLADWVGLDPESLPQEAREVAAQCGGLPFALALQGALAHDGVAWVDLLDALHDADLTFARQHFPDYPYPDVLATIEVSLSQLKIADERAAERMLELGAFFWEEGVSSQAITSFWEHRAGLSPRRGRRLLVELERKALIRLDDDAATVRIHDLIADYLRVKAEEAGLAEALLKFYRAQCEGDWPSGPDDGYFQRHLLDHLSARGDRQEIDRLLSLTAVDGANAWFQASDRAGHLDAYRRQLERRIADPANGLESVLQLAASLASVNSMADMLPPSLSRALVEIGDWTEAQALNYMRQVLEPAARAAGIVSLFRAGDGAGSDYRLLDEALAIARGLEEIPVELIPLIHALADAGRDVEALDLARRTAHADPRTTALTTVVPYLDGEDRKAVLDEAIEVASQTGAPFRAAALEPILAHVGPSAVGGIEAHVIQPLEAPSARGACQVLMVSRLVELGEDATAWALATAIEDPLCRAEAVVHCLPGRPGAEREPWIDEVISAVLTADRHEMEQRFEREFDLPPALNWFLPRFLAAQPVRASILGEVAPWLAARHVTELLEALAEIEDALFAAEGAAALEPVLDTEVRKRLFDSVEPRVGAISPEEERVRARAALAALAPDDARPAAFAALLSEVERVSDPFKASGMARVASIASPTERDQAIDLADRIDDATARTESLEALIDGASPTQLRGIAGAAMAIRDDQAILFAVAALAEGLDRAAQMELLRHSHEYPDYPRARVVALLVSALADSDVPEAVRVAEEVEDPGALAEILLPALAARVGGVEGRLLLERGIAIAAAMTDPERRIWALQAMIDQFDEVLLQEAIRAFEAGEEGLGAEWAPYGRALLHSVVAPVCLPGARAQHIRATLALVAELEDASLRRDLLARIADMMDDSQWVTATELIAGEEDPYERAMTCGFVLAEAPEAFRPTLVYEAMREFEAIEATEYLTLWERQEAAVARILAYSADPLDRLHLVERMNSDDWKRAALVEYGRVIPVSTFHRLTTIIASLGDPRDRASVEVLMASRASGEARDRLLAAAFGHALDGEADLWHDTLLTELADSLCELPSEDLATLWRNSVHRLANMSRANLAAQLHGLAPVVRRAGVARPMAKSLLDAQRWWP